ncbi:hypothetical protein TrLO_g11359 [Triparma laevis f. longispina]|uniref:Uncharacterized protein n=1 Tax=Triparma laevis f. longispina TaxID=1714387 RepID=A0A9W7F479_9STRA|nr:hypothetical protein TrLO_g11359 [Triparma laevis f. longispina]
MGRSVGGGTDIAKVVIHRDVDEIEDRAFYECTNLTEIDWADSKVTKIGENAFRDTGLEKFSCPDSVKVVGWGTVARCNQLRRVGYKAEKIAEQTFCYCEQLETVILKEGVKTIERIAFKNYPYLSTCIWAKSIEEVGEDIFHGCTKLHELVGSNDQEKVIEYLNGMKGTPLMKLCQFDGKLEDIKKILEENPDAAKVLVEAHPDGVKNEDTSKRNPVSYCCQNEKASPDGLKVLVEAHPEGLKNEDTSNNLPLHYLIQRADVPLECVATVALAYGDALLEKGSRGVLPLHYLCTKRNTSALFVKVLIEACPSATLIEDEKGKTPLMLA